MKIIAVVVTFNRRELLKRNIECLRRNKPVSSILVVNNGSTDGTKEWLDEQKDLSIIHQANVGGSGGFYTGIEHAYQAGADWIWCMDDDVFPRENCLEQLLKEAKDQNIGILAPRRLMDGKIFCHDFQAYNLNNPFASMYAKKLVNEQVNTPTDIKGTAFEGPLPTRLDMVPMRPTLAPSTFSSTCFSSRVVEVLPLVPVTPIMVMDFAG